MLARFLPTELSHLGLLLLTAVAIIVGWSVLRRSHSPFSHHHDDDPSMSSLSAEEREKRRAQMAQAALARFQTSSMAGSSVKDPTHATGDSHQDAEKPDEVGTKFPTGNKDCSHQSPKKRRVLSTEGTIDGSKVDSSASVSASYIHKSEGTKDFGTQQSSEVTSTAFVEETVATPLSAAGNSKNDRNKSENLDAAGDSVEVDIVLGKAMEGLSSSNPSPNTATASQRQDSEPGRSMMTPINPPAAFSKDDLNARPTAAFSLDDGTPTKGSNDDPDAATIKKPPPTRSLSSSSSSSSSLSRQPPPPPQILCHALTYILQQPVQVDRVEAAGTWGGVGWKRALPTTFLSSYSSSVAPIQLPLYKWYDQCHPNRSPEDHEQMSIPMEWNALLQVFSREILTHPNYGPIQLNNMRQAVEWHNHSTELLRNNGSPLLPWWVGKNSKMRQDTDSEQGHALQYVSAAIKSFQAWLLSAVARYWIGSPRNLTLSIAGMDQSNRQDDLDDLFQDEDADIFDTVADVAQAEHSMKAPTSGLYALDQILTWLEDDASMNMAVNNLFLDGLIQHYQEHFSDVLANGDNEGKVHHFLAEGLLRQCFCRLQSALNSTSVKSSGKDANLSTLLIRQRLAACTNLCTRSSFVAEAIGRCIAKEAKLFQSSSSSRSGRELERSALFRPLFFAAALSIPDISTWGNGEQISRAKHRKRPLFMVQLEGLEDFPFSAFSNQRSPGTEALHQRLDHCNDTMKLARKAGVVIVTKALGKNKQDTLRWISALVSRNEALATMLQWELLDSEGITALSSSQPFLIGLANTLVSFCSGSLLDKFEKHGAAAFDHDYLHSKITENEDDRYLLPARGDLQSPVIHTAKTYTGATEFFFLTSSLLRVGLYPALRVEEAFHQRNSHMFSLLTAPRSRFPDYLLPKGIHFSSVLLGWSSLLNGEDTVSILTDFALLQLRWLAATAKTNARAFEMIPEWYCKDPSWWLAHVARNSARHVKPPQADAAVTCTTELLRFGSDSSRGSALFSPVVLSELTHVASAFVQAGVSRATRRHRLRVGRDAEVPEEDLDFDLYLTFDRNDLGVSVFTNHLVCTQLCPSLMTTFSALDIIEGLDVDKEHAFDKFSAKVEIGDLLLRLWSHPNGECRASIHRLENAEIASFVSSLSVAIGFLLDDAIHRFADVCNNERRKSNSLEDRNFADRQATSAVSSCSGARRLSHLLCQLSKDERIAQILGGASISQELANMVVHFVIGLLTTLEGGTKPDIEIVASDLTTQAMSEGAHSMSREVKSHLVSQVLSSRQFAYREIGLDVAALCHMFLALAASWHHAGKNGTETSAFLDALSANDDCDELHLRNVYHRIVRKPGPLVGTDVDNAEIVFEFDGYVDKSAWLEKYHAEATNEIQKDRWRRASKYRLRREMIEQVAPMHKIEQLLDDLSFLRLTMSKDAFQQDFNVEELEVAIFESGIVLEEAEYSDRLGEWIVSSDSFASSTDTSIYAHYFDKTARSRGDSGSGKVLVKEAHRCHKGLPAPHPNSASFVCFDESRMDLCRAVVTGPSDTPYAHGLFVFDVFFPPTYPQIPPLVSFMTTGGGTVRFGPNLYQDGKVCLSLLGTFHARDESERWRQGVSSLAQILLSIQTQLLNSEPYFNEPGVEQMQGTPVGRENSRRYNSAIRLNTLRHTLINYLKEPPKGFEEVSQRHFSMCRKRIAIQALRWMVESRGTALYPKFEKLYPELLSLLSSETFRQYDCLPPLDEDLKAIRDVDPTVLPSCLQEDERKPPARLGPGVAHPSSATHPLLLNNPWADGPLLLNNPWAVLPQPSSVAQAVHNDMDEDEDFYS